MRTALFTAACLGSFAMMPTDADACAMPPRDFEERLLADLVPAGTPPTLTELMALVDAAERAAEAKTPSQSEAEKTKTKTPPQS